MNLKSGLILSIPLLLWSFCASAQSIRFDANVPATEVNDQTRLTVLNGRFCSRFTLSYAPANKGFFTGSLGFDSDEVKELLADVEVNGKRECFRTSNLPTGVRYMGSQSLQVNMTSFRLSAKHSAGLSTSLTVVSPYTPTETLDDEEGIKLSTAPLYYLVWEMKNEGAAAAEVDFRLAFKSEDINDHNGLAKSKWWEGKAMQEVYYRDASSPKMVTVLASVNDAQGYLHYRTEGFNGLANKVSLLPGQSATRVFVYAAHNSLPVMKDERSNTDLIFYYNKFFGNINEVLAYGRNGYLQHIAAADKFENVLLRSKASPEEKWVTAMCFKSDLANSFMVMDKATQKPAFYLEEGRFKHMNTIDVAHETEMNAVFNPWRLKLQIAQWLEYFVLQETLVETAGKPGKKVREGVTSAEFGPYLYHDVGDYPFVMKATGYEFGPYMAIEENSNFPLLLYWYWKTTGDDKFVKQYLGMLDVLLQSMINRDSDNSGIADQAVGWSTYDVSDAIKRSPENTYFGVKQFSAYLCAAEMFEALAERNKADKNQKADFTGEEIVDGQGEGRFKYGPYNNEYLRLAQAKRYRAEATKILATLKKADKTLGYIPVSLDKNFEGWNQRSIVLGEGLMYPGLCGAKDPLFKQMAALVAKNYPETLKRSTMSYGVLLSDGEDCTWFSKIMVSDIMASYMLNIQKSHAGYTYKWNKNNYDMYQDGAHSDTKPWEGNRYPRGISAIGYLFRDFGFTALKRGDFINGLK